MPRGKAPYRLWKKDGRVFMWCSPESPGWKSTHETSRKKAEAYVQARLNTAAKVGLLGELPEEARKAVALEMLRPAARMTLGEYLAPYFIWPAGAELPTCPYCARRKLARKQIGRGHVLATRRVLERHVLGDPIARIPVGLLTQGDVEDWQARVQRASGDGAANKALVAVRTCLRNGVHRRGGQDQRGAQGGRHVHRRGAARAVPGGAPGPWEDLTGYCVFLTAASTGMRAGEILALRWGCVDFDKSVVRVERAFKYKTGEIGRPKWDRVRTTPLPARTAAALKALRRESLHVLPGSLVFAYGDGTRLGDNWWAKRFARAMRAAGIDAKVRNLKPHSFRHSLATMLADQGYAPEKIRATLGWTNVGTQQKYTHWGDTDLSGQAALVDRLLAGK